MSIHILILNHNGRSLLAECLPSVLRAAQASCHRCQVTVIDNDSSDDSVVWLGTHFPEVRVERMPNLGLCSFNRVLRDLSEPVAVLLNNDVKLGADCLDPWVRPLLWPAEEPPACFMTAPQCRRFDGTTYEGFKTAVRWSWGLVQATGLFAGHEALIEQPGWTASAGAALAVDRRIFIELGGFDPRYLPGRLEDLDFSFRGYMAGYAAWYIPEAVVYHQGMATFGPAFGAEGCDRLALRNTLLWQWKNLRHPWHLVKQAAGLAVRLAADLVRAPLVPAHLRWATAHALNAALVTARRFRRGAGHAARHAWRREMQFFRRFHPRSIGRGTARILEQQHALKGPRAATRGRKSVSSVRQ